MNIFVLDWNPKKAARYHCDKHVVKMILESAQILCTARIELLKERITYNQEIIEHSLECEDCREFLNEIEFDENDENDILLDLINETPYKAAFQKHPCVLWAKESVANYFWLITLAEYLCLEFEKRFEKEHKSKKVIKYCRNKLNGIFFLFEKRDLTIFRLAMPEDVKNESDPIEAYRNYYRVYKSEIAEWNKGTNKPHWY